MSRIPLMNLTRQYENISTKLNEAVLKTLSSGQYILGEEVGLFEKRFADYCGTKYAIGVGNGTDALTIALKAIGITHGDEVITCAMSFFSTAEAIASVGAVPVFVDCTLDTYTIDVEKIEEKINKRTKAIIPVHLYGQCANMDRINDIAKAHGLKVIEDAAQSAGARYKGNVAGSLGDLGCFSLFPTKNLGCAGDGGIIVTNNEDSYKKCMAYRVHGSGVYGRYSYNQTHENIGQVETEDFEGNLPKYYNYFIGYNSRLDAIQAAILNVKLDYLDAWNDRRREIANSYNGKIKDLILTKPKCANYNQHIYYVYVLLCNERDAFKAFLEQCGISSGIYFPVPLHLQKAFGNLGYSKGDMPNSEYLADSGIAIPMFAELSDNEVDYIVNKINLYQSNYLGG